MSRHVQAPDLSDSPTPLCGFCGGRIGDDEEPCPGNAYHDGPCTRLCTVRKAAFGDVVDTYERHVDIFDIEDVADARPTTPSRNYGPTAVDGGGPDEWSLRE